MPGAGVDGRRPRVVIVGAGFAGLTVAKRLAKAPADIILIDKENYHLFQPLLYQVATAGLSPADIAWPIRSLVRDQRHIRVLLGEVTGVDHVRKRVNMGDCNIAYDVLVLATGATHGYFGNDSWAAHAPGLKTIDDATEIRRRLLLAFERAEMESDARQLERLLTIVIVGGGSGWSAPSSNWRARCLRPTSAPLIRSRCACCCSKPDHGCCQASWNRYRAMPKRRFGAWA